MSYQSKFTGEEIDNLLSGINGINTIKKVLWEGELKEDGATATLNDRTTNYDLLLVEAYVLSESNEPCIIETVTIDTNTLKYSTANNYTYNIFSSTEKLYHHYRILFLFNDETTLMLQKAIVEGTAWKNPCISKVTGIKFAQSLLAGSSASNPIGSILPIMGAEAPQDYLICDGSELNIAEYKELANYFEKQFGSKNYFGGDGINTFAIPDLRNEFLRGYGELSGEVGEHQDATEIPYVYNYYNSSNGTQTLTTVMNKNDSNSVKYPDSANSIDQRLYRDVWSGSPQTAANGGSGVPYSYTSRPTNVAVLFCIKYTKGQNSNSHPIYTNLISDNITTKGNHTLLDNLFNYDEILVEGYVPTTTGVRSYKHSIKIVPTDIEGQVDYEFAINMASESSAATYLILFGFGTDGKTLLVQGFHTTGGWSGRNIGISKIQGIKY